MTATISIPQNLYRQVNETAQFMGVSQRRFLILAIQEYLSEQKKKAVFEKLNTFHKNYKPDEFDRKIEAAGIESIRELTKNDTW